MSHTLSDQSSLPIQSEASPKKIVVGQSASLSKKITDEVVRQFAQVTGDFNPIHLDDEYAAQTSFKKRIAHGALLNGLFSQVAGTQLPGPGSVVLSAEFNYKKPAYIGDEVTATITVRRCREDKPLVFVDCLALNQLGEVLISGTAVIMMMAK